ncbi:MAG: hypothetical protein HOO67_06195 [Candidatus Peribacteraceae bacterium]|nr:hypothetical protein [Candidatus Peribacteraceae bacterium]
MATGNVVEVVVKARDEASAVFQALSRGVDTHAEAFKKAGLIMTGAGAAITGSMALFVKAAADSERAWSIVTQQVANTGLSVEQTVPKIKAFSTAMMELTGHSDEAVGAIVARMLPATKDLDTAMRATQASLDLAATGFVNLDSAQRVVAQAMDGNVEALRRYVPGLRNLTQEQINAMTATQKQELALKSIQQVFGSLAAKEGASLQGRMAALKQTFGELQETLGVQLLPVVIRMTESLRQLVAGFKQFADEHPVLTKVMVGSAAIMGVLLTVIGAIGLALPALIAGFAAVPGVLQAVFIIVGPLVAAWGLMEIAIKGINFVVEKAIALWNKLADAVKRAKGFLFGGGEAEAAVAAGPGPAGLPQAQMGGLSTGGLLPPGGGGSAEAVGPMGFNREQLQGLMQELLETTRMTSEEIKVVFEEMGIAIDEQLVARAQTSRDFFRGIMDGLAEYSEFITQRIGTGWDTVQGFMKNFTATTLKTFHQGMSSALSSIVLGTATAKEAFSQLGQQMVKSIVDFMAEMAISFVTSKILHVVAAKVAAVTGSAVASAWAPAAAFVSLATFGGNAGPAAAGIAGVVGLAQGIATASAGVTALAKGGIVTEPTLALIGERGPEAVIPLNKAGGMGGVNVTMNIPGLTVRSDDDIRTIAVKIAEELGYMMELGLRRPVTVG